MKHTQGEWTVKKYPIDNYAVCVGDYDPDNTIADCFVIGLPTGEVRANAKLIAAAPSMLSALINLRDSLHENQGVSWSAPYLRAAEAAIKKATL